MSGAVRDALAIAVQVGQPVLLWGAPGEGKTRLVEQVAAQLGRRCEVVVGSVREASDFAGIPMRVGDSVSFVPPRWAQRCVEHPMSVVFLDELTTASPSVQAAMLRVVLEREVGDLTMPSTVSIIAAANPPDVAAGGDELAAPLANRFCHLTWAAEVNDWVAGMLRGWEPTPLPIVPVDRAAEEATWRALVVGFIQARPALLRNLPNDIARQGRAWPSPRTWDSAFRLAAAATAAHASDQVRSVLVAGVVGDGPAIEFLRYARDADLPDPEALLMAPWSLALPDRPDLLLAALAAVTTAVAMDCTEERWNAAWEVLAVACGHAKSDVAAMAATELLALRQPGWPPPRHVKAFIPVLRQAALL
jgi:MoxR-like ATPase